MKRKHFLITLLISSSLSFLAQGRYLIGASKDMSEKVYSGVYNELFFNTFNGADAIFGEKWASAWVGLRLGEISSLEFGPLWISWVTNADKDWLNLNYLQLTWVSNIDWTE